jgi:hypothetical protein
LEEIAKQEAALLEARSAPLRRYLIDNVIPTLTQGLMEVSKVKPKDPVDYLVQILVYAVFVTEIVMSHAWLSAGGIPVQECLERKRVKVGVCVCFDWERGCDVGDVGWWSNLCEKLNKKGTQERGKASFGCVLFLPRILPNSKSSTTCVLRGLRVSGAASKSTACRTRTQRTRPRQGVYTTTEA